MKVLVPLAKTYISSVRNYSAASVINAGIQRKIHGSGTATLIVSNEEMNDITKIGQVLDGSYVLLKGVFLIMLFGALGASLLRNLLTGKKIVKAGSGNKKGKGIVRAGYGNEMGF